jgi:phosphoribosyl 1,2-cyclic phosphate phosphodiesterase
LFEYNLATTPLQTDLLSRITFLGTGTSQGIPVIGCKCEVCLSIDPRDKRLRSSLFYSQSNINIVIDVGPDFRQQMLRHGADHLDAIFLTHEHNDHVIGMDDIRPFNFKTGKPMQIYALPRVAAEIKKRFDYVFGSTVPGIPRIELVEIEAGQTIELSGLNIETIEIMHGVLPILAFKFGVFLYITDMKTIAPSVLQQLVGVEYLVINALHRRDHPAHMNLQEALAFAHQMQAKRTWLTHMSHHMGQHAHLALPDGVEFAFDGLTYELPDC